MLLSFIQSLAMDHVVGGTYKLGLKIGKGYLADYLGNLHAYFLIVVNFNCSSTFLLWGLS